MTEYTQSDSDPLDQGLGFSLVSRFLKVIHRNNLKGKTLLTLLLARHMKSLQDVTIKIADWPPIHMDMRCVDAHEWFVGSPFAASPHEVSEQAVMRRFVQPGTVVFDIGANVGLHTILLSRLVGAQGLVVSFEPNAELFRLLECTVRALTNVKLYPYALSDKAAESLLFVPDDNSMGSLADWTKSQTGRVSRLFGFGQTRTLVCKQLPLDELLDSEGIRPPEFIKCDVEGAELMVFKGGHNTLNRHDAPLILFEGGVESTRGFDLKLTEAADYLASLDKAFYQFFEMFEGGALRPVRPADFKAQNQNLLAVPKTKAQAFSIDT